ncbi:MAG: D-tyrosyl-tRNA(Tyr) deacylase [Desulfobulbaceae bacterium]|jgi:D-tyrosyl-tRNA(Tyr) deacylase|nr:D-tyrosyl-tRNA(Tyr) deacylase [Desulfobulbaceae bacterium]
MRAVLQRVRQAEVAVDGERIATIGAGLLVFLAVGIGDDETDVAWMVDKVASLRIFADAAGKMNRSVVDVKGEALVVSQFTLYGDCRKGRRPGFSEAAPPTRAKELYLAFIARLRGNGLVVAEGIFQADMQVSLINDGPVTLLLDSEKRLEGR